MADAEHVGAPKAPDGGILSLLDEVGIESDTSKGTEISVKLAAKKVVFVASSNEAKKDPKKVDRVVAKLKAAGFDPLPWWDAFPPGSFTLERLIELTRHVDAAIFVATGDDTTWYRRKETTRPRDNVIFEFGLFMAVLGRQCSLLMCEEGVGIPSDLGGLTYIAPGGDFGLAAEEASKALAQFFSQRPPTAPTLIVCEPDLVPITAGGDVPKNWLMKRFYVGTAGARAWLAMSTDPKYREDAPIDPTKNMIDKLLNQCRAFRTFVSLGPGDGFLDRGVAASLRNRERRLNYVPVDLSDGLLLNACRALQGTVHVPVGIFADFEDKLDFVIKRVREHSKGPYLYGLFGGTFGALDESEATFVDELMNHLDSGDEFMFDVALLKPGKTRSPKLEGGTKEFFAHGAAVHLNVGVDEIRNNFSERAGVRPRRGSGSAVPDTRTFLFYATNGEGEERTCAKLRRFELASLVKWLTDKKLEVREPELSRQDGPFDMAVLAVRRPSE